MFNGFYGGLESVVLSESAETLFTKVKDAAGIHFSTFQDPKKTGKSAETVDTEEESIATAEAAGRQITVRSNHRPDAAWKARNFAPADPNADRGIKVLEYR